MSMNKVIRLRPLAIPTNFVCDNKTSGSSKAYVLTRKLAPPRDHFVVLMN
jgi:hypothetical protein